MFVMSDGDLRNHDNSYGSTSDERIKKNIVNNNIGLDKIKQIQVRNFEYRTVDEITDFDNPKSAFVDKEGTQLGVIAQELETILPEWKTIDENLKKAAISETFVMRTDKSYEEVEFEVFRDMNNFEILLPGFCFSDFWIDVTINYLTPGQPRRAFSLSSYKLTRYQCTFCT